MPLPLLAHLWLFATAPVPSELAPGEVDAVEVPWATVQQLRAALEDPSAATPGPWVRERELELQAVEGGLALQGRWTIEAPRAGWVAQRLLGPGIELRSATLGGKVAPAVTLPGGTMLIVWVEHRVELEVRAFIPSSGGDRLDLALMPATRGRLRVSIPGRVPVPRIDEATGEAPPVLTGGVVWSGASTLALELRDPSHAPPARPTLAVAHAGVGLTVGDAEIRGRAHLQWELRHGELSRVRATVQGVGEDLEVEGRDVARWTRTGDTLEVELTAPATARVDLELRWTQAVGTGDQSRLGLPQLVPEAWRSESSLQLARDGEIEVIPEITEGTAIAAAALPGWGQGLVEGTPSAAYQRTGGPTGGHLDLLRFVPVPGPPTVIDVATYTIATTEEGRMLMKAHYDLRNDRGAHLLVRPPEGMRIIGARVGRETALPSRDDAGAWRIPLRRSLETVDGLLSFPVEVILLGERKPWQRRERRELPLPTLDAPVATARVTVFLPPGYRSRLEAGERNVVDGFGSGGEGLTYGRGVGADDTAVADALLEEAVQGYLDNDFEQAQQKLAKLEALGLGNENVARLRANIDVIDGKAKDKGDVTLQRRIKEQAKVRASDDFRRQETLIADAEQAAEAGDYASAEAQYRAALDLGGKLAKLEQAESVEQDTRNAGVELKLETIFKKSTKGKKGKSAASEPASDESGRFAASVGSVGSPSKAEEPSPEEPLVTSIIVEEPSVEPLAPEPLDRGEAVEERSIYASSMKSSRKRAPRREAERPRMMTRGRSRNGSASSGDAMSASSGEATSAGVALYSFEDDGLDGLVLSPDGAVGARPPAANAANLPADDPPPADGPAPTRGLAALPAPTVTASALSVVIPATGVAVRYQQLLIEANQTQTVEIHARRRLRR